LSTSEITIRGAGIFGLSIAWSLLARGARVRIIDPNGPGSGASGGIVGALSPHVPENWNEKKAFQFESLILAEAFWAEVAHVSGQDPGYARLGRLQPILAEADIALAQRRCETAVELWQGRYSWQVIPDTGAPISSPTGWLVHDNLSARIHPRQGMAALAEALHRRGAEFTDTARGLEVWATGVAGLEKLSSEMKRPIGAGIKGQAALLAHAMPDTPQLFADGLHIIPHSDGTVAIGSTTERDFEDATRTDAQLDALIAKARSFVPTLADAPIIETWAGLRPRARSRAPILGQHPTRPDVFIANGGFKIGFGMAPKIAAVMADLILDGRDAIPDSFRLSANL